MEFLCFLKIGSFLLFSHYIHFILCGGCFFRFTTSLIRVDAIKRAAQASTRFFMCDVDSISHFLAN